MSQLIKQIIGDATVYLGDALEILPQLEKADLAAFDPPYVLTTGGGSPTNGKRMSGKFAIDKYDNGGQIVDCDIDWHEFMPVVYNALVENAHCYVMANNRHVLNMLLSAQQAGFGFHNLLYWRKTNSATANRWYMKNNEFVGFFYKGKAFYINDCGAKQDVICPDDMQYPENIAYPIEKNTPHPTQKPVALMQYYIEQSSQPGQLVLDPFAGSGSTGVAALRCGRRFIGIEKNQKWFDLTCTNLEMELTCGQVDLFTETAVV